MSMTPLKSSLIIDANYLETLESREIDLALLETQYDQLINLTKRIKYLSKKLHDHSYDNLFAMINESRMAIEDLSALLKDITLSVFYIFSSKYMSKQNDDTKKKVIQLEVLLSSLLETIPPLVIKIVRFELKNKRQLKPKREAPKKNGNAKGISDYNSFSDSIGSFLEEEDNDDTREIFMDLRKMKKDEGNICKNIETVIDCMTQSQHEYSLSGLPNKSSNASSLMGNSNSCRVITVFFSIVLVLCFIGIPLYFILRDVPA